MARISTEEKVERERQAAEAARMSELTGEEIGSPEEEMEEDRVMELLSSIAGDRGQGVTLFLHRAAEKNRAWPDAFVKNYPADISMQEIYADCQEEFGGGNFVLLARKGDSRIFKKTPFSVEARKPTKPIIENPTIQYDKHLERLTQTAEKRLVLDKLEQIAEGKAKDGDSGMFSVLTLILKDSMEARNDLMKILLSQQGGKASSSTLTDLMEAVKLGKLLSEGKLPDEGGEVSITDAVLKAIPAIVELISKKQPATGAPVPVVPMRGLSPGRIPAPPPIAAPGSKESATAPVNVSNIAFNRILDETRFCLTMPENDKMFGHLLDYTENYLPGSIDEMLNQTEDAYITFILQFDSAFKERESFFRKLYQFAIAEYKEPEPCSNCKGEGIVVTENNTMAQCSICKGSKLSINDMQ